MSDNNAQVKIAGHTDTGLRRKYNQDYIGFEQSSGIVVLADGMGGHKAGEVAAQMAVDSVLKTLQSLTQQESSVSITGSQLLEFVSNTISDSNSEIYQAAASCEEHDGMGTTIVAAIIEGSNIYVGHVGDSRLYLYREQVLRRITKDHSLVQSLIDKGFYTEQEARNASIGNVVTRALGSRAEVEVDTRRIEMETNDIFLLCSDGLTDMVSDWQIAEIINSNIQDIDRAANELVDLANKYGGKDNISVILIQVLLTPENESNTL
ncbi:MAG: protein phosphatase [SAR86 cluster bacterium]|uniref:Protein phosphatase n=1 Tax=SAR86 cluster bacterium TaxID=2030880 RepID=A0A2A5AE08_9GAMM|nr:MAG: protein phosphatase [SAR86 cluster bacterium]